MALFNQNTAKFLDASWYLNAPDRIAPKEFEDARIPGAHFFDIDIIADTSNSLPHMLPSESLFGEYMSKFGIQNDDHVIIYVHPGSMSAPRVWWTLKAFGHEQVSVLNGGMQAWKDAEGPIESGPLKEVSKTTYKASFNQDMVVDWKQVMKYVETGSSQILDARSNARFTCQAPEPRPGLERGNIPGSLNLPATALLKADDVTSFKTPLEIKELVQESGIILGSKVVTSCGTGVTASILTLGMHLLGADVERVPVYDGSWAEWGSRSDLPKVTQPYEK